VEKATSKKTDPSKRKWTYKNNIFDAGIETYKFTKTEIRDSATEGKKVLVMYCDITNNSKKEQDPSNIYMVVHAYQKTGTADKNLSVGMNAYDDNGNDPLQKYNDGLQDKLLAGKTTHAAIMFTLVNDNDVTVTFQNPEFKTIGKKVISVKGLGASTSSSSSNASSASSQVAQASASRKSQPSTAQSSVAANSQKQNQVAASSNPNQSLTDFVNEYGMSPAAYKMQHDGMSEKEALDSTPRGMKSSGEIQRQNELDNQQ
jgi:beta-N-acetylglucosaminidase